MGSLSKLKIPIGLDIADYKRGALDVSKLNRQMKADTDLAKASSTAFAGQTVRSGAAMAGLAATTSTAATVMLPFSAATLGAGGAMVILTKNAGSTRDVTQSVEKAVGKSISTLANFTNVSRVIPGTLQAFAKAAGVSREQVAKLTGATGKDRKSVV